MTKMRKELLSLAESNALRGIAILGIMLHNYCHFLGFAVKENEYTFTLAKPMQLLDRLTAIDHHLFVHIMSFFGHYGVTVFHDSFCLMSSSLALAVTMAGIFGCFFSTTATSFFFLCFVR